MLKLYVAGNSISTQKVLITLAEKQLESEMENLDLFRNGQYDPDYLRLNPKGVVPTLVHNDRAIVESTLICEYLDDTFLQPPLMPADPYQRAQARLWSKAVDEGLFEGTREISFSAMFRDTMRAMTPPQREVRFTNVGDPQRRARFMSTYTEGVASPYILYAIADFEKLFKSMQRTLEQVGPWLLGEAFTLADVSLMPYIARMEYLELLDIWVAERPAVCAWWQRARDRPSFRSAISDRLSGESISAMQQSGRRLHAAIQQRRDDYLRDYL